MLPRFERRTRFEVPRSGPYATILSMGIHWETGMAPIEIITLPSEKYRLEEVNLSGQMAEGLAGKTVPIEIVPEVMAMTRLDPKAARFCGEEN